MDSILKFSDEKDEDIKSKVRNVLDSLDEEELLSQLTLIITSPRRKPGDSATILSRIFLGTHQDLAKYKDLRFKLFKCVFDVVLTTEEEANEILEGLQGDLDSILRNVPTAELVKLLYQCLNVIKEEQRPFKSVQFLELLRLLIGHVYQKEKVVLEDDFSTMDGFEFRSKFFRDLCAVKWFPSNAASLCEMLTEVCVDSIFSQGDHEVILDKLCSILLKLKSPQEVPPLVYQILKLTQVSTFSSLSLFKTLSTYYASKLKSDSNSQMGSEDMIDDDDQTRALMQSEGTVMYHICSIVSLGNHPIAKEIPKIVRTGVQAPELVLDQFMLFLSLAISSKIYHQAIVDSLKATFVKNVFIQDRRKTDSWFRTTVKETPTALELLTQLIEQANLHGGWDLIVDGIFDVALSLLDVFPGLGKPDVKTKASWNLGKELLLKMTWHSSGSVKRITDALAGRIISSQGGVQYTDCLKSLVKESLSLFMENPTLLHDIADYLCSMNSVGARRVLIALLPIIKVNRSLRDTIILILRKALFSRSEDVKQTGITGVLFLMQLFKITSSLAVTQMSQSSSSSMSQLASGLYQGTSASHETLCNELLGVLRRGLHQSPLVRLRIYHGLYDVVSKNPELCNSFVELLWEQAINMNWANKDIMDKDSEVKLIILEDLVILKDGKVTILDPAGWFVHCAQQIITKWELLYSNDDSEEAENPAQKNLTFLLKTWTKKYSEADLTDMGFEKQSNYSSGTEEGEKNILKVQTVKNVLESLMEFVVMHSAEKNGMFKDPVNLLLGLNDRYTEVSALLKTTGPKGGGGGKRAGDKKNSDKENKDQQGNKKKIERKKDLVIKTDSTWNFAFSLKALALVLKNVLLKSGIDKGNLSNLGEKKSFVEFVFGILKEKEIQMQKFLDQSANTDSILEVIFRQLCEISNVLQKFLNRRKVNDEDDEEFLTLVCSESSLKIMEICLTHFPRKEEQFIKLLCDDKSISNLMDSFEDLAKNLISRVDSVFSKISEKQLMSSQQQPLSSNQSQQQQENEIKSDDFEIQIKTVCVLLRNLKFLMKRLNFGDPKSQAMAKRTVEWLRQLGKHPMMSNPLMLKPFVELYLFSIYSTKLSSTVLLDFAKEVHHKMGDLDEALEVSNVETFSFVTKSTGELVLSLICQHMERSLESAELVISNCKQILAADSIGFSKIGPKLESAESGVCIFLADMSNVLAELSQSGLKYQSLLDQVVKILVRYYTVLDGFAKYLVTRSKTSRDCVERIKFDQLVMNIQQNVTENIDKLPAHLERIQNEIRDLGLANARPSKRGGKGGTKSAVQQKSSVNKEIKAIPNLTFKLEQFQTTLLTLGNKCKINLSSGEKKLMSRDFRITSGKLAETTANAEVTSMEVEDGNCSRSTPNAESTRLSSQNSTVLSTQNSISSSQASSVSSHEPASKKLKVKITNTSKRRS